MPTYVYRCQECHEQIEAVQRFSDLPLSVCPHCGGSLQRLLFAPAIIFKGSGWYCTDYGKSSSPGNGSSAEKVTSKTSEKKEEE
ncbi:MAG: FmdB family zinc ribbon protein [Chloroflexia bacterium]